MTWNPDCSLCSLPGVSTYTITDRKLYDPIATFLTEDSAKLSKLLSKGFEIQVYRDAYKVIVEKSDKANIPIRDTIDFSCQRINRMFVLAYEGGANRVTADS